MQKAIQTHKNNSKLKAGARNRRKKFSIAHLMLTFFAIGFSLVKNCKILVKRFVKVAKFVIFTTSRIYGGR